MLIIDFEFVRSKVKVTMVTFIKNGFSLISFRTIYQRVFIFDMLIGLGKDMTYFVVFTMSNVKVKVVIYVKHVNMDSAHYLENYTSQIILMSCAAW